MHFEKFDDKYVIVLARGELVMASLSLLMQQEEVQGGFFTGLGAVDEVELAVYDVPNKTYHRQKLDGVFEVTNLTGSIGMQDDQRIVHGHITLTDEAMVAKGGHLVEGRVSGTMEIVVLVLPQMNKVLDEATGLNVFDLPNGIV